RLVASGSTFFINLPALPDSTNFYSTQDVLTNTFSGTQIGGFKVASVSTNLSRPEAGALVTSTFTNLLGARVLLTVVGSNGKWTAFSAPGDALSGMALTSTDINTSTKLLAITTDLF